MKTIISMDSTMDLTPELVKQFDIRVIPLTIILGDKDYEDGITVTPPDIFAYVEKTGILPKTSAVSSYAFREHFEKLLKECDQVLHVSISQHLSACWQNATLAASELKNVYVVDGGALSTGTSLLAMKARDLLDAGTDIREVIRILEGLVPNDQTSFVVDKLEYLYKGGRCSGLTLLGANLLKIHPILNMQEGYLKPAKEKLRGNMDKVLRKYIEYLHEHYPIPDRTRAFITHTEMDPELVEIAKRATRELFDFETVYETMAGSTITCHCGKGTLGLLFLNDKPVMSGK